MRISQAGKIAMVAGSLAVMLLAGARWGVGAANAPGSSAPFSLSENKGKFTLHAVNAPVKDVLLRLGVQAGLKLTLDEKLKDVVTVDLKDLSAEDLLKALSKSGSYVYEKDADGSLKLIAATASSRQQPVAVLASNSVTSLRSGIRLARGQLSNVDNPRETLIDRGSAAVVLENAVIDTAAWRDGHGLAIPEKFRSKADERNFIIQFDHVISGLDREAIGAAGGKVSHYIPNNALFVIAEPGSVELLKSIPGVVLVEPYHPYFKLSRDLAAVISGQATVYETSRSQIGRYNVLMVGTSMASTPSGTQVEKTSTANGRAVETVAGPYANVVALAQSPDVLWVEPAFPRRYLNDLGTQRIQAKPFKKLHPQWTGKGVIIGLTDSGVDVNHQGFSLIQNQPTDFGVNSRVIAYYLGTGGFLSDGVIGDNVGHGSHVAGIMMGNGALSPTVRMAPGSGTAPYATNQFAGVAQDAFLAFVEDPTAFSDKDQVWDLYKSGARLGNNSWGAPDYQYDIESATWDGLVLDANADSSDGKQPFIEFFAAGNDGNAADDGTGGTAGTIGSPGNAKNVITVGAVEQVRHPTNYSDQSIPWADSDWQIASYSSRGPISATDLRYKPDIVAPGSYVLSVQSKDTDPDDLMDPRVVGEQDYRYGNLDSGTNYAFMSGTSMATPMTTGAGALLFQYYTNTYSRVPSPAMMKAMLCNGARTLNSIVYAEAPGQAIPVPQSKNGYSAFFQSPHARGRGIVDVVRSVDGARIHPSDQTVLLDEGDTTPLDTGVVFTRTLQINPGEGGFKVTMAYSDVPGVPGNGNAIVNDLDLIVVTPDGRSYLGNYFSANGVDSQPVPGIQPVGASIQNIEQVVVGEPSVPGTYTIKVVGYNVPQGPQSFALSVMKGIQIEGRIPGNSPAICLDTNNNPVVAYSGPDTGGDEEIFVRRWVGPIGDSTTFGSWLRLEDQWAGLGSSANRINPATISNVPPQTGISLSLEPSRNPSVAVDGQNVYVAWEHYGQTVNVPTRVYLKQFNGSGWVELNNSARGDGVSGATSPFDSLTPVVKVVNHVPVVAWRQVILGATKVMVAYWNGSSWAGLGGSNTNGLSGSQFASSLDMVVDGTGALVVAWEETSDQKIHIRRWFSNSWTDLGVQGAAPIATNPRLAADTSGGIYLTWLQAPSGTGAPFQQVYASKYLGGSWQDMNGSSAYPGVSANSDPTNAVLSSPSIAIGRNNDVFVSWVAGNTVENAVFSKKYSGGQWIGAAGATVRPGVGFNNGISARTAMVSDTNGVPYVAFDNTGSGVSEVFAYALSSDRTAPFFNGIQTAIGNTNGGVIVGWSPATSYSTTIVYRIFRSTTSVPCGSAPACDPNAVFTNLVATVTNQVNVAIGGLTTGRIYCFGVRAVNVNGYSDQNTVMLAAGPQSSGSADDDGDCLSNSQEVLAGTDTCQKDTDGDGMWDGWEWAFSTNNPAHTNKLSMDPLDNGLRVVHTGFAGSTLQDPLADLDGDGLANIDEFNWWLTHGAACPPGPTNSPDPTSWDTDGDGMPDGWEVQYGLSPVSSIGINGPNGDPMTSGVPNIVKYQYGLNPFLVDSDGDGLSDSNEIYALHSDPASTDSDQDGLDDDTEIAMGLNPVMADSATNSLLSDGDFVQLGWTNRGTAAGYDFIIRENFETSSRTNWVHSTTSARPPAFDLWNLSVADPQPPFTNHPVKIQFMYQRTTNVAYRMARDTSATPTTPGTNLDADYNVGAPVQCALYSPVFDATPNSCLFMQWNEFFETEPYADYVQVQAAVVGGASTNWFIVGQQLSGFTTTVNPFTHAVTNGWAHRTVDMSHFAGQANVQVRFLFTAQNSINNNFRGWWVDDVYVYGGVVVSGWVRDVRGRPIDNGTVYALGLGGVTNRVEGNKISGAGKIFASAKTAADGSFVMAGLPHGLMMLKATAPNMAAEFYNGPLFAGAYAFGAGITNNFGLQDVDYARASSNGILNSRAGNSFSTAFFELDQGKGRAFLGVAAAAATSLKLDNQAVSMWNGSTTAPALVGWSATTNVATLVNNHPDWELAPKAPSLLGDIAPGTHWIMPSPNQGIPLPVLEMREGEDMVVQLGTNQTTGLLYVWSKIGGSYNIWIDGTATATKVPGTVSVKAGTHYASILDVSSNGVMHPAVKKVVVNPGTNVPARLSFGTNDLSLYPGVLTVQTLDIQGNVVTGAQIVLNGALLTTNDVIAGAPVTPTTIRGLLSGEHYVSAMAPGYRPSEVRTVSIFSGSSNSLTFVLYDADRDYDQVGDSIEILGYTNIFLYSRSNDPDQDGLSNLQEYDLFREFNIRVNPFNPDIDGDGLKDGAEVSYDGSQHMGLTRLATNAVHDANWVATFFAGKYLAGVDYFKQSNIVASIDGDRFEAPISTHPVLTVPNRSWALTVFTNIAPLVHDRAVSQGHNPDALVYADTRPDLADSDGDGMWDGFETKYSYMTSLADGKTLIKILDPLEAGGQNDDPDADGLTNLKEFLGPDGIPNLLDSTDPTSLDSDGDGIPDAWEINYGLNPLDPNDAELDPDNDGLINRDEYYWGTDPINPDTDGDFLPDGMEVNVYHTDPNNPDTDGDGLIDGQEVWDKYLRGVHDGGWFPMWNGGDLDGDGLVDGPTDWDTDGDGMPDGFEVLDNFGHVRPHPLDPYNPYDGAIDSDGDGLSNLEEYLVKDGLYGHPPSEFDPTGHGGVIWQYSTDPFNADSDGDGMPDGFEVQYGLAPMDPSPNSEGTSIAIYTDLLPDGDPDHDGLWNDREFRVRFSLSQSAGTNDATSLSTSPWNPDTDGDGLGDGEEDRVFRTNPVLQDTDSDHLTDGVSYPGKAAEVETVLRKSEFKFVPGAVLWTTAQDLAHVPHPFYPWIFGHLAVLEDTNQIPEAIAKLLGANNVAIGGYDDESFTTLSPGPHWITFENPPPFPNYLNVPAPLAAATNFYLLNSDGTLSATLDVALGGYLIEWDNVPQTDAHYDGGTNDLWVLGAEANGDVNAPLMPVWQRIIPDDAGGTAPAPEPRWGQAAAYNPVYVAKNSQNLRQNPIGATLMDNRKIIIMGGSGGVSRYKDIWEFWLNDATWHKSLSPLDYEPLAASPPGINWTTGMHAAPPVYGQPYANGLSEASAFMRFIDLVPATIRAHSDGIIWSDDNWNNINCPCVQVPWTCNGQGFGEPKQRPWGSGGLQDRSFEITYLFDGFDTAHIYHQGGSGYKSADDPNPLTENSSEWDSAAFEYIAVADGKPVASEDLNPTGIRIGNGPPIAQPGSTNILGFLDGSAGFTIQPMPFMQSCEQIISAQLHLRVDNRFGPNLNNNLGLEFGSVGAYNNPSPGARNIDSTPIPFAITAGENDTRIIDITTQFNEVLANGWGGPVMRMGFLIKTPVANANTNAYATILKTGNGNNRTYVTVTYKPSWKLNPNWPDWLFANPGKNNELAGIPTNAASGHTISLTSSNVAPKSTAIAYDYTRDRYLVFGGIDGRGVCGDTWEAQLSPQNVFWAIRQVVANQSQVSPPARWGHQMVYDKRHDWYVLFGGFDMNHKPLNDLWLYVPNATLGAGGWVQVTKQSSTDQWPRPRGGHSMIYWGDFDWHAGIADYAVTFNNLQMEMLFGGTDGNTYFNDTWLFNGDTLKWTLVNPSGIWGGNAANEPVPSPRAFASLVYAQNGIPSNLRPLIFAPRFAENAPGSGAAAVAFLFGGHDGALPTGRDTDFDLVDDGEEHEINGNLERDPRFNKMFMDPLTAGSSLETLPYNFIRIGSVPPKWSPAAPAAIPRGALADFESLNNEESAYANLFGFPSEPHPLSGRVSETLTFPFPVPNQYTTSDSGVDANAIQQTQLWWHQYGGVGSIYDSRDVWQLGAPDSSIVGTKAVPPTAYSGRWCYGTKLNGFYPAGAIMDLYSPLVNLAIPVVDSTSANPNLNDLYLIFHEWLDLASSNDTVHVDMLRPVAGSDVLTRKTGLNKPLVRVLPKRNNFYNTAGAWRRMIVPLNVAANETNFYFRFTLQSSSNSPANGGGWYIDDVAIVQGGTIAGTFANMTNGEVVLLGVNSIGSVFTNTLTDSAGNFQFGLLPDGDYQLGSGGGIIGSFSVGDFNGWNNNTGVLTAPDVSVNLPTPNPGGGMIVTWPTTPGLTYRLEYSDDFMATWHELETVTASGQQEQYIDYNAAPVRLYRVILLNNF